MGTRRAVVFTINHTVDDDKTPGYLPGVLQAVDRAKNLGWLLIGVYHDEQPEETMNYIARMLKRELRLNYINTCGHGRNDVCLCGKPQPYLVNKALAVMQVDPEDCIFIGSSYDDVSMGRAAGIERTHFVVPDTAGFRDVLEREIK
jgi:histidinol phosphatase-like enzyme